MAVKRRTIWMTDEEWADLLERSSQRGITASAYIRAATVGGGFVTPQSLLAASGFNSRPFTPVPKKGK